MLRQALPLACFMACTLIASSRVVGAPDDDIGDLFITGAQWWGVAVDSSGNVYAADFGNHRVLEFDNPLGTCGSCDTVADRVFGQPDFVSTGCNTGGISATSLCGPSDVAVDSAGNLYVAEFLNNRVLVYLSPLSDSVADRVFGQASMTTNSTHSSYSVDSVFAPVGIDLDNAGYMYMAEWHARVLGYDPPLTDTTADRIFGQFGDFTGGTHDLGGTSADTLAYVWGLGVDPWGNLYIGDGARALRYNTPPSSDTTADLVFGQFGSFTTRFAGGFLSADTILDVGDIAIGTDGWVYITDRNGNRTLAYDDPASLGTTADFVYGQGGSFTTNTAGSGPGGLRRPQGVTVDASCNLWVADTDNGRIVQYGCTHEADVTTEIHDSGHADITGTKAILQVGKYIHDKAIVTGSGPVPTGTVDFTFYISDDCTVPRIFENNVALDGSGTTESTPIVVTSTYGKNGISYRVHYDGDSNYPPADGPCEILYRRGTYATDWNVGVGPSLGNSFTPVGPTGGFYDGFTVPDGVLREVDCSGDCPIGIFRWFDEDADGLPGIVEIETAADPEDPDTDNDGLNDFEELAFGTDPDLADTDGDGSLATGARTDAVDNCRLIANATQADADADAIGDACDANPGVDDFPGGANNDGDGLAAIKSTSVGTRGAAELTTYGASGNGGCSAAEEAANGTSDANPRDFYDVNNSGKVDAADTGQVRSGSLSTAGDSSGKYKRTLDLNAASASGGLGDGKVNALDIGLVRSQFNKTCQAAP
jgi:NHL repeat-containing protein